MKIKGRKLVKCEMKEVLKIATKKDPQQSYILVNQKRKRTKNVMQ